MKVFLTGASGCIGHYIADTLMRETEHELFLFVRNRNKLQLDLEYRGGINVVEGDLRDIGNYQSLLKTIHVAILTAAAWGGEEEARTINVEKTKEAIALLSPEVCQQVIYFSTASILSPNNQLLPEAKELGTDYIRTKYECCEELKQLAIANKITKVFPTLVFGGDETKPYSHLSGGLPDIIKWINLVKWFRADGSFHFIHGRDIATVVKYLLENPPAPSSPWGNKLVLGNTPLTANQAIEEMCSYLGKKIYFRFPLSLWLANIFIGVFRIQVAAWDRFCMNNPHFTYQHYVNPASFGLTPYCPSIADVLEVTGIPHNNEQLTMNN